MASFGTPIKINNSYMIDHGISASRNTFKRSASVGAMLFLPGSEKKTLFSKYPVALLIFSFSKPVTNATIAIQNNGLTIQNPDEDLKYSDKPKATIPEPT